MAVNENTKPTSPLVIVDLFFRDGGHETRLLTVQELRTFEKQCDFAYSTYKRIRIESNGRTRTLKSFSVML
jgi:hypothetical protein